MAKQFNEISPKLKEFMESQHIFFVGTAAKDGRVNISPKGLDSLRVRDKNLVYWLNVTGSGNETAAHINDSPRMTLMFVSFEGDPLILRLYGKARAIHHNDHDWSELYSLFPDTPGARQIFELTVDLVQTSCGMAAPTFEHTGDRSLLNDWAEKRGKDAVKQYWLDKNQYSIDGLPTFIEEKNT